MTQNPMLNFRTYNYKKNISYHGTCHIYVLCGNDVRLHCIPLCVAQRIPPRGNFETYPAVFKK